MPKMKEIRKVVQKLSREQESPPAAAYEPVQNIKSPPVYRGDLISRSHDYLIIIMGSL